MSIRNRAILVCVALCIIPHVSADDSFTYSFSNLFDGQLQLRDGFTANEMVVAAEESFALWASVAPLTFVETDDTGPTVSDKGYNRSSHPTIRIGHHGIEDEIDENGETIDILGHAFFPGSNGRDSDVHLDNSGPPWSEGRFFSVLTHEIGHAIGLEHFDANIAVMNSSLSSETTFTGVFNGQLFAPDIRAITQRYGEGTGDVIVSRKWSGGAAGKWSQAENWDKGHYPTQRAHVSVNGPATIAVSEPGLRARSITFAGTDTALRLTNGDLTVAENVDLGGDADVGSRHSLDIARGSLVIDGNLNLGGGVQSDTTLNLAGGRVEVGQRIQSGPGASRIVMNGGTLAMTATAPGQLLVDPASTARLLIPIDDSLGRQWANVTFDDSQWEITVPSIGYERGSGFEGLFAKDVESSMFDKSTTLYLRIPFAVEEFGSLENLALEINFDDGFVAYLNGQRVAARNAANVVDWNERALTSVSDEDAQELISIDLTQHLGKLTNGDNLLAIHGLNRSKTNDDFLLVPRLSLDQIAGVIEVDEVEFSGGRILGLSRIAGDLMLQSGEFSPDGTTSAAVQLKIEGELVMADEATLRLDFDRFTHDSIAVDGDVTLNGDLKLVADSKAQSTMDLSGPGSFTEHVLLTGSSLSGTFAASTYNGKQLGHMGGGLFRRLDLNDTELTFTSYRTIPGDANGDGIFDSADLVFVFTSNEYEDDFEANSDWTNGDWNGDNEFDSSDFIVAFQGDRYEAESIFATVPEPAVSTFTFTAFIAFLCFRRNMATTKTKPPAVVCGYCG